MRREIVDGQQVHAMFEVINLVDGFDIDNKHGKDKTSRLLKNIDSKTDIESFGIYSMKNRYGAATYALNLNGMKALMQYSTSPFAMKFKKHYIQQGTRVDAGDKSMHDVLYANAASSNVLNQMARDALPYLSASAGTSLAAPSDVVPDVQEAGVVDVGYKRKADEDYKIYDWQEDPRAFELRVKQYELDQDARRKNEAAATKTIKGAEAKVIAADAHVKIVKGDAEASVISAEARKVNAQAAKLEFELEQMKISAGIDTNAKKPTTSKHETPQERARKDANNKRAREYRAKVRTAKNNQPMSPKADA
jgi:hypothetical protein